MRRKAGLKACATVAALLVAASALSQPAATGGVRKPAVAGDFYPGTAEKLRSAIDAFLTSAPPPRGLRPVAVVVPHAGYEFSGQIAADAYRQAAGVPYDTVVILGTNHTDPVFDRAGIYRGAAFRTPLGEAAIDQALAVALMHEDPDVVWHNRVHEREHSVEVQVPFVQHLFPSAKILPIVVGAPDPAMCVRLGVALAKVLRERCALIVASSDLSHYPAAADARRVDRETLAAITTLDAVRVRATLARHVQSGVLGLVTGACGEAPILAAIAAASALGARRGAVISYANSADSPVGDPSRVVGYGAVVIGAQDGATTVDVDGLSFEGAAAADVATPLTPSDKQALVAYARETIRRLVMTDTVPLARRTEPRLLRPLGVFVTLKKRGELRGCIGRLVPDGPVRWLVGAMAVQAATNDPRFGRVRPDELAALQIEVSLLTPPREIARATDIVVGRDGVILVKDGRSAVFLPEVAIEQHWSRDEMLDNLCVKAGLSPGSWRTGARLATFQSHVIKESDSR
jgi:AmmeMemoRadiSam system protein B/AmmeMemoRadiSam system protein A